MSTRDLIAKLRDFGLPTTLVFHPDNFKWVSDEYAVDDRRYREAEHIASGQIIVVDCGPLTGGDEE